MKITQYIKQSLWHFKRQHIAVLIGTIISTAVLTGALMIGDSVKYSLQKMVDVRLGKTRYALVAGDRFFRSQLVDEISKKLGINGASLLAVQGIGINTELNKRANTCNVYGIDSAFWNLSETGNFKLSEDEVLINQHLAQKLDLKIGDDLLIRIQNADVIPLNAPFASQENPSVAVRVKVKVILNKEELGRFSLKSDQKVPFNIFLSRKMLAKKLELKGLSNLAIFANRGSKEVDLKEINHTLEEAWQSQDASLQIKKLDDTGAYELISSRIFIEQEVVDAIEYINVNYQPILSYLVNGLQLNKKETPYSFVAAVDTPLVSNELAKDEIIINQWLADDLEAKQGDSIQLNYYIIGPLRKLDEKSTRFLVKEIIPLTKDSNLQALMPSFPGLSDAGHCSEWETGVPIDLDKIRDKDEDYWNEYRGTPKAYISIEAGQKLWQNQFGKVTALRFNSKDISATDLEKKLIGELHPKDFNLNILPVYEQGMAATVNAVDFGELFLSLSFFVIVAGVLLTLLLYKLNAESRSTEISLLSGLGFTRKTILKMQLGESAIVIVLGAILGTFAGILYNQAIMAGLNSLWNDVVRTDAIELAIKPTTLLTSGFVGMLIAFISIYFSSKKRLKQQVAFSIKSKLLQTQNSKRRKLNKTVAYSSLFLCLVLLIYSFISSVENSAGLFLSAGGLFLVGSVSFVSALFTRKQQHSYGLIFNALSLKNAGRNQSRSITSITLLALGVFVIMITGANRKTFFEDINNNQSGTGGYLFWAEATVPIVENLNSTQGLEKMGLDSNLIAEARFMQFHSLEGNDASCLNLNQVQQPQILGVNALEFHQRKSFSFAKLLETVDNETAWAALNKKQSEKLIPAIVDQTVLTWGLKKSVGDTLLYLNEKGEEIKLLIIGGLNNSIFQGNVLIADQFFNQQFPSAAGSKVMLIDAPVEKTELIEAELNNTLTDYGLEISKTSQRLAEFNSVTNTYLAIFMALGALGVLIGTVGLGIVLLRNLIERKSELALLSAIGFTKKQVLRVVLRENILLLATGIVIGLIAAIIGILPSILSPSFEIPGMFVFVLILIVTLSGLAWIYFPTKVALKRMPVKVLRRE